MSLSQEAKQDIRRMLDWHPDRAQALLDAIDGDRINGVLPFIRDDGCGCVIAHVIGNKLNERGGCDMAPFDALARRLGTRGGFAEIEWAVMCVAPGKKNEVLREIRAEVVAWMNAPREALVSA